MAGRGRCSTSHLKRMGGTAGPGMAGSCRLNRARRTCTIASRGRRLASTTRSLRYGRRNSTAGTCGNASGASYLSRREGSAASTGSYKASTGRLYGARRQAGTASAHGRTASTSRLSGSGRNDDAACARGMFRTNRLFRSNRRTAYTGNTLCTGRSHERGACSGLLWSGRCTDLYTRRWF